MSVSRTGGATLYPVARVVATRWRGRCLAARASRYGVPMASAGAVRTRHEVDTRHAMGIPIPTRREKNRGNNLSRSRYRAPRIITARFPPVFTRARREAGLRVSARSLGFRAGEAARGFGPPPVASGLSSLGAASLPRSHAGARFSRVSFSGYSLARLARGRGRARAPSPGLVPTPLARIGRGASSSSAIFLRHVLLRDALSG